jgi:PRTRC genetic system protein B
MKGDSEAIDRQVLDRFARSKAGLFIFDDQYELLRKSGDGLVTKKLQPAQASAAFAMQPIDSGWLPAGVNRWGTGSRGVWMARWHAPAVYTLLIEDAKGKARRYRVPLPALVWFGQRHGYYIFAMKGDSFNPANLLYRAPLANVNLAGLVCFGKNAHPDVSKGGFDQTWRTFWQAPFNDDHDDNKSRAFRDSINDQLRALARAKAAQYPARDLCEQGGNLNAMIEKLTVRGGDGGVDHVGFEGDDDE